MSDRGEGRRPQLAGRRVGVRNEQPANSQEPADHRRRVGEIRHCSRRWIRHSLSSFGGQSAGGSQTGIVHGFRSRSESNLAAYPCGNAGLRFLVRRAMARIPRWVGLMGSWALLVLGVGIFVYAATAEGITFSDANKLRRVEKIDRLLEEQFELQVKTLQDEMKQSESSV